MACNVLLDANILIELLFDRTKAGAVKEVITSLPEDDEMATSIFSINMTFYYVEKYGMSKARAHEFIKNYQILSMDESDYVWARDNDAGDFEDALQIACARRHGCSKIITLDKKMDAQYGKHMLIETIA